jgi:hypothetical protein
MDHPHHKEATIKNSGIFMAKPESEVREIGSLANVAHNRNWLAVFFCDKLMSPVKAFQNLLHNPFLRFPKLLAKRVPNHECQYASVWHSWQP